MLLRRITEHFKAQNWTAVALDFFIVVVGVFIGIQVANWNDSQNSKAELRASLERLDKEVAQNIYVIDEVLENFEQGQADMTLGREALNDCDASPAGQAALERILFDLVADVQPNFVTVALDQIASQGQYQKFLSENFTQGFGLYTGNINEEHEQLKSHYDNMWAHHVNFHPAVSAAFSGDPGDSGDYSGWAFLLDKPFEVVCADAAFRSRFINTVGFYDAIGRRLKQLKTDVISFQKVLADELERF